MFSADTNKKLQTRKRRGDMDTNLRKDASDPSGSFKKGKPKQICKNICDLQGFPFLKVFGGRGGAFFKKAPTTHPPSLRAEGGADDGAELGVFGDDEVDTKALGKA